MATRLGSDPLVGQRIGNCQIEKRIGSGGMGAVYLAHHTVLDKPVAIKILSRELSSHRQTLDRFLREARLAASIDHPNVARVYDAGETGDLAYLVMQHIDGEGLDAILERQRKLDPPRAVDIVRQVASALAAAHARGVIHRDIKPGNILLSRDGVAHVVDFGLACSREGAPISRDGQVLGTADYISPEQAQGDAVDARADLYALGATFYHLVTGSRPFDGDSFVSVALKHVQEPLRPPHERDASIPLAVSGIILKLMAKKREERPATADAVIRQLDELSAPPPAPSVPASERPTRQLILPQVGPAPDTTSREERDRAIAHLAVETGLITEQQLEECAAELQRAKESGGPPPMLCSVLVSREYLSEAQLVKLRLHHGRQQTGTMRAPAPAARAELAPGQTVAGFTLVRRIAAAPRYTAWEAQSPSLGRTVALRLYDAGEARLARAIHEGVAAARTIAPHPNIVAVHDAGTHEDASGAATHYLALDLVAGKPLDAAVEAGIHPIRAARMGAQLAAALHHLHEAGRLHPPLHPAGVIVRPDATALLMPFDAGDETPAITQPLAAPEELPGDVAPVDEITDLYKLGVLLYYMVTARMPYAGFTNDELIRGILRGKPEPPAGVDPALASIILRAMARDRDARPPSALVLTRELEVFLGQRGEPKSRPVEPPAPAPPREEPAPVPEPPRPAPPVRRSAPPAAGLRAGFVAAMATLLLLGGAAAAILHYMPVLVPPAADVDDARRAVQLYEEKRWAAALDACQRALARAPDERIESIAAECRRHLAEQSLRDAIARARAARHDRDGDPAPKIADVQRALRTLVELADPPPPVLHAEALCCAGDADDAFAPLERAVEAGDDAAVPLLTRLWLERWLMATAFAAAVGECELQERAAAWNRTAARFVTRPQARSEATDAALALLNGDAGRARRFCDEALAASENEDLLILRAAAAAADEERVSFLSRAIEKRPHDVTALFLRSLALLRAGDARAASVDCDAALRLAPRSAFVALLRGLVRRESGDDDQAVFEWTRAAGLRADLADAHALAAAVRARQGRLKEAEEFGTAAIHAAPRWAGGFAQRARIRLAAGSPAEAVVDLTTALSFRPRDARLLVERGEARLQTKNVEMAVADFDAALVLNPSLPAALAGRGLARHARGDFAKAAADYEKALEQAPADWDRRERVTALLAAARERRPPPP